MFRPSKDNFSLVEVIPPELIERFGEEGQMVLSPLFCITLQQLRNRFGRMRFLSPRLGMTQRGVRTLRYWIDLQKRKGNTKNPVEVAAKAYDRYFGLHRFGAAGDVDFLDVDKADVIEYIKENPNEFPFLSFIEVDVNWFHFDVRNQPNLTIWSPNDGVVAVIKKEPFDWERLVDIEGKNFKGLKK